MLAGCQALNHDCPALVKHINGAQHEGDGPKSQNEQGKCRQKFPDEIKLHRQNDSQEPPHPLAAAVLGLHSILYSWARWSLQGLFLCCAFARLLDAGTVLTFCPFPLPVPLDSSSEAA